MSGYSRLYLLDPRFLGDDEVRGFESQDGKPRGFTEKTAVGLTSFQREYKYELGSEARLQCACFAVAGGFAGDGFDLDAADGTTFA